MYFVQSFDTFFSTPVKLVLTHTYFNVFIVFFGVFFYSKYIVKIGTNVKLSNSFFDSIIVSKAVYMN